MSLGAKYLIEMWQPSDLPKEEKKSIHQDYMDRAYADYEQKAGRRKVDRALNNEPSLGSTHQNFLDALSEAERIAVVFGNLNYQIGNGGISQWIGNNYYADTAGIIADIAAEYGDRYPAIKAAAGIIGQIEDEVANIGDGNIGVEDLDSNSFVEQIQSAINDEEWNDLDRLLGGTDYTQRRFERDCSQTLEDGFSIEVDSGPPRSTEMFSYEITCHDLTIEESEPIFANEDVAYEAGERRVEEFVKAMAEDGGDFDHRVLSKLDDAFTRAKDMVKDEWCQELTKSIERDMERMFDRIEKSYEELSPQLLEQVGSLLRTEFSVSGDIRNFMVKAVEKAKGLLAKIKPSGLIRQARSGASTMLSKAADKLRPESTQPDPIARILG